MAWLPARRGRAVQAKCEAVADEAGTRNAEQTLTALRRPLRSAERTTLAMNDLTHASADLFEAAPYFDPLAENAFSEPRSPEWVREHGLSTVAAALGLPLAWSELTPF
jgi:hypothetical protein